MAESAVVQEAAEEYIRRQTKQTNPEGTFGVGGKWYPTDSERQSCCREIKEPSRQWPYSLLKHSRSAKHVAELYKVEPEDLLALARPAMKQWRRNQKTKSEAAARAALPAVMEIVGVSDPPRLRFLRDEMQRVCLRLRNGVDLLQNELRKPRPDLSVKDLGPVAEEVDHYRREMEKALAVRVEDE